MKKIDSIKEKVRFYIRRVRRSLRPLKIFQPVVGCNQIGELFYGRYTGFFEPKLELYEIWTISGEGVYCTDVKKIKEKTLISWAQITAQQGFPATNYAHPKYKIP